MPSGLIGDSGIDNERTEDILVDEAKQSARDFIMTACDGKHGGPEFSPAEQSQILAVLCAVPISKMPSQGIAATSITTQRHAYLRERYAELERRMEQGKIRNPFAYFLKLLKQDAEI